MVVGVVVVVTSEIVETSVETRLIFMLQSTWTLFVRPTEKTFHSNPALLFGSSFKIVSRSDKNCQVIKHM